MTKLAEFSVTDLLAVLVALSALTISALQWRQNQTTAKIKLLLGEKETAGFQALQITRKPNRRVSDDMIRALLLVTIFEASDRARVQVFRALEALQPKHASKIISFRAELVDSSRKYGSAVDLRNFDKRLGQRDETLPWIGSRSLGAG